MYADVVGSLEQVVKVDQFNVELFGKRRVDEWIVGDDAQAEGLAACSHGTRDVAESEQPGHLAPQARPVFREVDEAVAGRRIRSAQVERARQAADSRTARA